MMSTRRLQCCKFDTCHRSNHLRHPECYQPSFSSISGDWRRLLKYRQCRRLFKQGGGKTIAVVARDELALEPRKKTETSYSSLLPSASQPSSLERLKETLRDPRPRLQSPRLDTIRWILSHVYIRLNQSISLEESIDRSEKPIDEVQSNLLPEIPLQCYYLYVVCRFNTRLWWQRRSTAVARSNLALLYILA